MTNLIDLHTDFSLAVDGIGKKYFGVDLSEQLTVEMLKNISAKCLLAGFSYDDMNNATEVNLNAILRSQNKYKKFFTIVPHLEGAAILASNEKLLETYINRGVRSIGIAHAHDNVLVGSSSSGTNLGLSKLGKSIIEESIKSGMLIDMAHMSDRGVYETLELIGNKPPLISHTACYSVEPNPRNTSDDLLKLVAERDGTTGIFFASKFISHTGNSTIDDVISHITHAVDVAGINHVSIGSDLGGITTGVAKGLESISKLPILFERLMQIGYSEESIQKISNLNAKRVLKAWLPDLSI